MHKHTDAINVLNDELEVLLKDMLYLQTCLGHSMIRKHLFPEPSPMLHLADLRWQRILDEKITKSKSITDSIKALEDLDD
jgi:hypothetical protein